MYDAPRSPHTFHIPVMGTGFMIDAPLRLARYGIGSVISLVDDALIEQMRAHYCRQEAEPYEKIADGDEDARARRITAYLNLVDRIVRRQVNQLRAAPFVPGSEITRYYELLPESPLLEEYRAMRVATDPDDRRRRQERLRRSAVSGSCDVNIMAKGDREPYRNGEKLPSRFSDASAALRGFAESSLRSSLVLSAGMNPRLYGYLGEFPDFFPDEAGQLRKTIILKVGDYRSAEIQAKYLAKRGLWASEFRVESGLNCGGHAFPSRGRLLGPILEEFREKRDRLIDALHTIYSRALAARGGTAGSEPRPVRLTVQGGIGTAAEDRMLREFYGVDGTGWGTPFLLVPEVTNVDDAHLELLISATAEDVVLSNCSPFGLPFWSLRTSASEATRRRRIDEGRPGSPCTKGYIKLFNTEFTSQPICTASQQYQQQKLRQLAEQDLPEDQRAAILESVLGKSCICHDLAGGATQKHGIDPEATPAVCCGPNIIHFSRRASLEEMVGHIYGHISLLLKNTPRPHMLLRELALYLDYLRDLLAKHGIGLFAASPDYFCEFTANLREGIDLYRRQAEHVAHEALPSFLSELDRLAASLDAVAAP